MIDFTTLQGLTIPEGVVTQIADASGRVLWMLNTGGGPVILEVEKITSDTYAAETTYTGEQFILLDIYPKTNGTVNVTYGGLTKTITDTSGAEEPNAQQVFFGTFNGVADSVTTPASGELVIEGDCYAFGCGAAQTTSKATDLVCGCSILSVESFGAVNQIPMYAFGQTISDGCTKLQTITIPSNVRSIGDFAFIGCTGLLDVTIQSGVQSINFGAFSKCTSLTTIIIPKTVASIASCFSGCNALTNIMVDSDSEYFLSEGGALFDKPKKTIYAYPSASGHYTIPDSVTSIGVQAFQDSALISVTIPESVTSVSEIAFGGCTGLTSITIPASVTTIGGNAFSNCANLTSIIVLPTTPPTGGMSMFYGSTCPITVPKGCGEAYKTAEYWSDYAGRIVEAS